MLLVVAGAAQNFQIFVALATESGIGFVVQIQAHAEDSATLAACQTCSENLLTFALPRLAGKINEHTRPDIEMSGNVL